MRNDRIDAATSSLCFISRCKVPHYFLPVQYPKVGKKKEFYKPLSPKISFVTYKSPFSLPTNSETRPRRLRSHRLSPTMKAERCCSNANKSPTFAVKRRTFTTPVQCCFLAMRVGVSRHAETRLVQRHFGNQAAAVHECQCEAELSAIIGRLVPHQQAEGRHVQRRLGLRF